MENENTYLLRSLTNFSVSGGLGKRHLQVFLLFLGMTISYGLRVSMSVAIVAMTDNSTIDSNFEVRVNLKIICNFNKNLKFII